jgi:hypothetical protein
MRAGSPLKQTLTIAEICRAITDGLLIAHKQHGYYVIRQRDLRQLIIAGNVAPAYAAAFPRC